jgi:hypothetical protein
MLIFIQIDHRIDWNCIDKHITVGCSDQSQESRIWNKPDFGKLPFSLVSKLILYKSWPHILYYTNNNVI